MKSVFSIMQSCSELTKNKQQYPVTTTSDFNSSERNTLRSNIIYRYVDPQYFINEEHFACSQKNRENLRIKQIFTLFRVFYIIYR